MSSCTEYKDTQFIHHRVGTAPRQFPLPPIHGGSLYSQVKETFQDHLGGDGAILRRDL